MKRLEPIFMTGMNQAEYAAKPRPPFRPSNGDAVNEITTDRVVCGLKRDPIIRVEMERVTNMIHDGIDVARHLVESLSPILGAISTTKETVEPPKDNSLVPPMVHTIREQIEGLRELVEIIKDAASRVEV